MEENFPALWQKNEANIFCNIVSAGFRNLMPSGVRVTIIKITAKFNYEDGTSESSTRNVRIVPQGADEVLMSSCTDKCVKSVVGTMTVLDQQGGSSREVVLEKTRFPDTPTECLLVTIFPLGKNPAVDATALQEFRRTGDTSIFYTL
jgi:hypothetical protein